MLSKIIVASALPGLELLSPYNAAASNVGLLKLILAVGVVTSSYNTVNILQDPSEVWFSVKPIIWNFAIL